MFSLKQYTIDERLFTEEQIKAIIRHIIVNGYSIEDTDIAAMKEANECLQDKSILQLKRKIQKLPYESKAYLLRFCLTHVNVRKIKQKSQRRK